MGGPGLGGEWEGSSGALVLPGERSPEWPGLLCPVSPPWGRAQPCPAHPCSLSTDPRHDSREPSLPPGTLGGAADPSLAGHLCPRPHRMPWVGWNTPQLSLCLPWDRMGACPPAPGLLCGAPHSLGPSPGIPLPCGRSVRFQMKTKLWRDGTRTAGSPPWPGGACGFPAPAAGSRGSCLLSQLWGCSVSLLADPWCFPGSCSCTPSPAELGAAPPPPASHHTPPCTG